MLFILFCLLICRVSCEEASVLTSKGPVKGQIEFGGDLRTFYGVPYAEVDASNPFGDSLPYPIFTRPFEASENSIKCPQLTDPDAGTLQCLRLNIYVPKTKANTRIPVLVWFHGGGFFFGSGGDYTADYLRHHNIILVTANYRLGPYGFFCLDDKTVPGNQGLKDQVAALKWVKENIATFNGDPDKVTIAGESYGGGSVELHLYRNNEEGEKLFHKAIMQSGAADAEGMFVNIDNDAPFTIAKLIKSDVEKKDALKLLAETDTAIVMKAFKSSGLILRACKEKIYRGVQNFLNEHSFPYNANNNIRNTKIMIGYNSKETFSDVVSMSENKFAVAFKQKLDYNFNMNEEESIKAENVIKKFYIGSAPFSNETILEIVDFSSDFMVNHPAENAVNRIIEQGGSVYKYLFSYVGNSPYKNLNGVGAFHTEELQFLFPWNNSSLTKDDDILMRDRMTAMWANFVKHGNPTPQVTDLLPVKWVPVTPPSSPLDISRPYLNIDLEMEMKKDVYHQRIAFWDLFWEVYGTGARRLPTAPVCETYEAPLFFTNLNVSTYFYFLFVNFDTVKWLCFTGLVPPNFLIN